MKTKELRLLIKEELAKELKNSSLITPINEKLDPVGKEDDDVDNDGDVDKTDKYLLNRRKAIKKASEKKDVKEALNPEVSKTVNNLIKAMAKRYDYSEQDAVFAIIAALKQRDFDGVNEEIEEGEGSTLKLSAKDMEKLHKDGKLVIDDHTILYATGTPKVNEDVDLGHEDNEPHMLKADLYRIGKYSMDLYKILDGFDDGETEFDFPHWWQSKIVKARLMLTSAKHYLDFELKEPEIDAMVNVASEEEIIDEEFVNITPNEESGEAVEAESDGPGY